MMYHVITLLLLGTAWASEGDTTRPYDKGAYNSLADILFELERLVRDDCPLTGLTCNHGDIGMSAESRAIKTMTISTEEGNVKPIIAIDALMNPREWISGTTAMLIADRLILGYGNNADVTRLLDKYAFVIIPVLNPDGYLYTWTDNRFWRKNREVNQGSSCVGTDLNRNFNYDWGGPGSSGDPCAETYRGASPASAIETQRFQNWYNAVNPLAYLSLKSYGQYLLHPYGDTTNPPNLDDLTRVVNAGCLAIEDTYVTSWQCGNSGTELYPTSGTSADWVTAFANAQYSFSAVLRGSNFDPPTSQISPAFEEMWNGLVAMVDEIALIEGL